MALAGSTLDGLCPYASDIVTIEEALRCACLDDKDAIYNELWHACAGPDVNIPVIGQKVFYFPQGHLEQVQAHTCQGSSPELPSYKLPSSISCTVIHVQLKAEVETDEVYAQVTLLPDSKKYTLPKGILPSLPKRTNVKFFCKPVTASDTSTHGGFSVLRRHAEECFPPLDMKLDIPTQEFQAKDLHDHEWYFRHIFRGQPKRHLLSSGWSTFVSAKKIIVGDNFIFLSAENGEYRVGVRRSKTSPCISSPVFILASRSMQLGVLATAYHALSTGTMFTVYYRPRTCPDEFIIPYDDYINSLKNNLAVGMVFKMKPTGDECSEESLIGTITGIGEVDPVKWPQSKWRCLKVHWNRPSVVARPERISPWKLEPLAITDRSPIPYPTLPKRPRTPRYASIAFVNHGVVSSHGLLESEALPQGRLEVLQDQEKFGIGTPESANKKEPSFAEWISISSSGFSKYQRRKFDCQLPQVQSHDIISSNMESTSNRSPTFLKLGSLYVPYGTNGDITLNGNDSTPVEFLNTSLPVSRANLNTQCMIFGVDLLKTATTSTSAISPTQNHKPCNAPTATSQSGNLELHKLSKKPNGSNSSVSGSSLVKQCGQCSISTRSCIKVHKHGTSIGRIVDLQKINGYEELMRELDRMFDFKGELIKQKGGWHVIYTDEEGDNMLVGDSTWGEFKATAQKLRICPMETNKL